MVCIHARSKKTIAKNNAFCAFEKKLNSQLFGTERGSINYLFYTPFPAQKDRIFDLDTKGYRANLEINWTEKMQKTCKIV